MIRKKFYELEDSFWDEIFPSLLQANIEQKGNRLEARIAREIKNQQTKFTLLKSDKKTDYKSLYVMSESQDEEEKNILADISYDKINIMLHKPTH